MTGRFIISRYERDKIPTIARFRASDYDAAWSFFITSAKRRVLSVVLYYTGIDAVINFAIDGEPIYLVRAIERARNDRTRQEKELNALVNTAFRDLTEAIAGRAIDEVVKALTGVRVPGLGGVFLAQFSRPYFAVKRKKDRSATTKSILVGGVSGAAVGFITGGPIGGIIGGIGAVATAAVAAPSVIESFSEPFPTCTACRGAGMIGNYHKCSHCCGKGYRL